MKKDKPKPPREIGSNKRSYPKSPAKDVHRAWTLAARLEHRRVREKKK